MNANPCNPCLRAYPTILHRPVALLAAGLLTLLVMVASKALAEESGKEPLVLTLPAPTLKGTPEELPSGPNVEPLSKKPRPPFLVARGAKNVALSKPVTSSIKPGVGDLAQITDGKKEPIDRDAVEFKKGTQWVQVDLGQTYSLQAVALWHDHRYISVVHDVIVQASNDPEFKQHVATLFNNDADNSSGVGAGTDREYFETEQGRVVDGKSVKARYVRSYRRGSSLGALNSWLEVEVYAVPVN